MKKFWCILLCAALLFAGCLPSEGRVPETPGESETPADPADPETPAVPEPPAPAAYLVFTLNGAEYARMPVAEDGRFTFPANPKDGDRAFTGWYVSGTDERLTEDYFEGKAPCDLTAEPRWMEGYGVPIVMVDTGGKEIESKEDYLDAEICLYNAADEYCFYDVSAGVRGRGNFTWTNPKKGYRIKFGKKRAMLSDYAAKSWTLIPSYNDKTLMRDYIALDFARNLEGIEWTSSAEYVELYLNGAYNGVYLLCEQNQVNENRVDVEEGSLEVDTGYFIERDQYAPSDPTLTENVDYFYIEGDAYPYNIKSPERPAREDFGTQAEYDDAMEAFAAQREYIKDYMSRVFAAVRAGDWNTLTKLCDIPSMGDFFIPDQVFLNWEIDRFSNLFFYKDKGEKLKFGPLWDFELSAGFVEGFQPDTFYANNQWFSGLYAISAYRQAFDARLRELDGAYDRILTLIDAVSARCRKAFDHNFTRWEITRHDFPENTLAHLNTYEDNVAFYRDFMERRIAYLKSR